MSNRADTLRKILNKSTGHTVAYDLGLDNPTDVKMWIPTGSRWLDSIIAKGVMAGIPSGKICELAGGTSAGKSYLAHQIGINAKKMGFDVIYFDSESAVDSSFIERMGVDLNEWVYVQAESVEMVFETIETLLELDDVPKLFVWDSLAMTPCKTEVADDYNPTSSVALRPRILSKGMKKLTIPLANKNSSLLIVNQLYTNITNNRYEAMAQPFESPGGKAIKHAFSLSIWLTGKKGKDTRITNEAGDTIGTETKAVIEKSRFGTWKRNCEFKLLWGGPTVAVQDEQSWLEAIKGSPHITTGQWWSLTFEDGSVKKFRSRDWLEELRDPKFKERVLQIMDELLIHSFKEKLETSAEKIDSEEDLGG